MIESENPLPVVGPWAQDKLSRLGKYLSAYTTILKSQSWIKGYFYVDALAGAGRSLLRREGEEPRELLDGSPRIALNIRFPFTNYIFVEKDAARVAILRSLQQEFRDSRHIEVIEGDCGDYLRNLATNPPVDFRKWRGVVFLDPFGMQVPWDIVKGLGSTRALEVFLNFPVGMAIQRLLLRQWREVRGERRRRLDSYFGGSGWFDAVYPQENTLFGPERGKAGDAAMRLVDWYRSKLAGAFGFVSQPCLVRNSHGGHLYYLIWAGPNKTGLRIANFVLSGGRESKIK